jgi:hypothetical protein
MQLAFVLNVNKCSQFMGEITGIYVLFFMQCHMFECLEHTLENFCVTCHFGLKRIAWK